ncbi:hypothetical protein BDL97_02G057400 [Sphagnum fallax]|nr:hypothetical protein BDL97_02G057400 [Sphagnum fallax]
MCGERKQVAGRFFLAFFLSFSIFSLQPSASAALWTKEIKTTDVGCKSNALKREDEADHISI